MVNNVLLCKHSFVICFVKFRVSNNCFAALRRFTYILVYNVLYIILYKEVFFKFFKNWSQEWDHALSYCTQCTVYTHPPLSYTAQCTVYTHPPLSYCTQCTVYTHLPLSYTLNETVILLQYTTFRRRKKIVISPFVICLTWST